MLGMKQLEIESRIDSGAFGVTTPYMNIREQEALQPNDILKKLVRGVAEAIVANNERIQEQLAQRGYLV